MSIIKLNNRSVKDVTAFGSISSLGSLTHIATQLVSSSSSINFTSGIDSTYKEYIFYFVNLHVSSNSASIFFNGSIDGGSNYNVTKTTTNFEANHDEADSTTALTYKTARDLAQSTSDQILANEPGNDNDQCASGFLHLFSPSNTTFVKHFLTNLNSTYHGDYTVNVYVSGYFNTTSAINAITFKPDSGTIDSGQILLFGLN